MVIYNGAAYLDSAMWKLSFSKDSTGKIKGYRRDAFAEPNEFGDPVRRIESSAGTNAKLYMDGLVVGLKNLLDTSDWVAAWMSLQHDTPNPAYLGQCGAPQTGMVEYPIDDPRAIMEGLCGKSWGFPNFDPLPPTTSPPPTGTIVAYDIILKINSAYISTVSGAIDVLWSLIGGVINKVTNCNLSNIYVVDDELHVNVECNPIGLIIFGIVGVAIAVFGWLAVRSWSLVNIEQQTTVQEINAIESTKLQASTEAWKLGAITDDQYAEILLNTTTTPPPTGGGGIDIGSGAIGAVVAVAIVLAVTSGK